MSSTTKAVCPEGPALIHQPAPLQQGLKQNDMDNRFAPGGCYETHRYRGIQTCLLAFICPCVCLTPLDEKVMYREPETGRLIEVKE
mmetsp:Transcript_20041/g.33093  ORF Transcript_20041/g.33093 Transcript_20041/m.33093 type:complete len:86 (+) Transcript_20041:1191-1448(+)